MAPATGRGFACGSDTSHVMPLTPPLLLAWDFEGRPLPRGLGASDSSPLGDTACRLCGLLGPRAGYKISKVVSDNSTIWDDLRPQDGAQVFLCEPCAWSFRKEDARTSAFVVTTQAYTQVSFPSAAEILVDPMDDGAALSFPISGRKHTLPFLSWGRVSTDADTALLWGQPEADLACAVYRLRLSGAQWRDLADGRFGLTSSASSQSTHDDWELVTRWRASPQLAFVVAAFRKSGLTVSENRHG